MSTRFKTLVLEANGTGFVPVAADTFKGAIRRMFGIKEDFSLAQSIRRRSLVPKPSRYETMSYTLDWRNAFCAHPDLQVDVCNINDLGSYASRLHRVSEYALIVVLHTAAGDSTSILRSTARRFRRRAGKLLVFLGNEYALMDEKIELLRNIEADYICSQLPLRAAEWLYAECTGSRVLEVPHALNPDVYYPDGSVERVTDVGFVGDLYHTIVGDAERSRLIGFFSDHGEERGLKCDIRTRRLPAAEWARFLNSCRAVIGAESGTYYLDRKGEGVAKARAYVRRHPDAAFGEVFDHAFKDLGSFVSGKAISSRHFEPIGTKTCQVLIEGEYNGILQPDEHYISVRKDLSNIDDVLARAKDKDYREAMVERTHQYVISRHTYRHRIDAVLSELERDGAG